MVDQLVCMFLATAFIITMHEQICLVSCKSRSSLDTWPTSAVASSLCLGPWVFLPLYSLFVTFMGLLSVISGSVSTLWDYESFKYDVYHEHASRVPQISKQKLHFMLLCILRVLLLMGCICYPRQLTYRI